MNEQREQLKSAAIAGERLRRQHIVEPAELAPVELVRSLGALQAQDHASALWAVGLRTRHGTEQSVEAAIRSGAIVRTWAMRRTMQLVPADDAHWMLALTGQASIPRTRIRAQQLGVDDAVLARAEKALEKALAKQPSLLRSEALALLERHGESTAAGRGLHILAALGIRGVLCFGPPAGKQPTFVLLDAWVRQRRKLAPEEALATLASRYFTSRAPATAQDFAWWSGLPMAEAKRGFALAQPTLGALSRPLAEPRPDDVHLLPAFDEYLLAYKERGDLIDPAHAAKVVPGGNGVFRPILVARGRVVGTWARTFTKREVRVELQPFAPITRTTRAAFARAAERLGAFYERSVRLLDESA